MTNPQPVSLVAVRTAPGEPDFQAITAWPFPAQPFYEGQVIRLLRTDIPQRDIRGTAHVWVYRDSGGNSVGFGTLDFCNDYAKLTGGLFHAYIPLLAVNPSFQRLGHGRRIVEHLTEEARLVRNSRTGSSDYVFLDVYTVNQGAIVLYQKCGFEILNPDTPILDANENNEPYFVMAKKLTAASA